MSIDVTTSAVTARSLAARSNADSTRASRLYTQPFGNGVTAPRSFHFSESTSTMSSTNGTPPNAGRTAN